MLSLKSKNISEAINLINDFINSIDENNTEGLREGGPPVVNEQQQRARVDKGNMRNETGFELISDGQGIRFFSLRGYSGYQDQGTRYITADYFWTGPISKGIPKLAESVKMKHIQKWQELISKYNKLHGA